MCGDLRPVSSLSARMAAVALSCFVLVTSTSLDAREALESSSFIDWVGHLQQRPLDDGSTLVQYVASTRATDMEGVSLSVEFIPRFGCTPHIRLSFEGSATIPELATIDRPRRFDYDWSIDGDDFSLEGLVERDDSNDLHAHLLADRATREQMATALAAGQRARVSFPGEVAVEISLLGSRKSLVTTRAHCLRHEPVPFATVFSDNLTQ